MGGAPIIRTKEEWEVCNSNVGRKCPDFFVDNSTGLNSKCGLRVMFMKLTVVENCPFLPLEAEMHPMMNGNTKIKVGNAEVAQWKYAHCSLEDRGLFGRWTV